MNLQSKNEQWLTQAPFYVLFTILVLFVSHNSFFGDAIQLGSKQAHWFFDNDFRYFFLPKIIDSGHPPLFGIFLAIVWKVFGKSLFISHLAVLPFIYGTILQVYLLSEKFFQKDHRIWAMAVLLADPTILGQSISVSPDIPLLFFFLVALNQILLNEKRWLVPALVFLSLISMRGMMHVAMLAVIGIAVRWMDGNKNLMVFVKDLLAFVPAGFFAGLWLYLHYLHNGWIGYHGASPWAESFQIVDLKQSLRNILVLFWRVLDFGRIALWLIGMPLFYYTWKRHLLDRNAKLAGLIFSILILLISPNLVIHSGLLGHRYLLAVYFTFALFVLYLLELSAHKNFKWYTGFLLIVLLSGNLWRYPEGIAQGWDSTLGVLPYDGMRKEMIRFIQEKKIYPEKVGSGFPNISNVRFTDLSPESWSFEEKDLEKNKYIFYSNVFNDFSDKEIEELKHWKVIRFMHSLTVDMILYQKP